MDEEILRFKKGAIICLALVLLSSIPVLRTIGQMSKSEALYKAGDFRGAIKIFDKKLVTNPHNIQVLLNLGLSYEIMGNHSMASDYFNKVIKLSNSNPKYLTQEGLALAGLHHFQQALPYFQRSVTMNSNNPDNWDDLGHILQYLGNFTGALKSYDTALKLTPHNILIIQLSIREYYNKRNFTKTPEPMGITEQQQNKLDQKT
jgi:tetratricopeptide (TPR) repeat protein